MSLIFGKVARSFFLLFILLIAGTFFYWELISLATFRAGGEDSAISQRRVESLGSLLIGESSGEEEMEIMEEVEAADARLEIIKRYLEHYRSPLLPYSEKILEAADENGIDYYWIVAIAQQESNLCKKIPENSFNCWGYGINSKGTLKFENYEIAIDSYANYLKRQYFDKGLTTTEAIMRKYCPHSPGGAWAKGVNQFIEELESGEY